MAVRTVYMAKSRHKKQGRVYEYAYLRYEVWDPGKGRYQPQNLASLGRTERLDEGRTQTLVEFLREVVRKDSTLPFEALRERFEGLAPSFRILCSRDFGLRFIVEQAWKELGYAGAVTGLFDDRERAWKTEVSIFAGSP